jgi:fused signal recognition particle receptor
MFRKLTFFGAVYALIVMGFGTYINLTNQGLGCEDWPACYAKAITATGSAESVTGAESADSPASASLSLQQVHLYLAAGLGMLGLAILGFSFTVRPNRGRAIIHALLILLVLGGQACLGMQASHFAMLPIFTTAHQMLGLITVWVFAWTWLRLSPGLSETGRCSALGGVALFAMIILLVQSFIGASVNSFHAGLVCRDFPLCDGTVWVQGDVGQLLSAITGFSELTTLDITGQKMLHVLHRLSGMAIFAVLMVVVFMGTGAKVPENAKRSSNLLSFALLVELLLGIYTDKQGLPLAMTLWHAIFAALLMLPLFGVYLFNKYGEQVEFPEALAPLVPTGEPVVPPVAVPEVPAQSLYQRLSSQLHKTRGNLAGMFGNLQPGQTIEQIETSLLMADLGIETTGRVIDQLKSTVTRDQLNDADVLSGVLKEQLYQMLLPCSQPLNIPKKTGTPYVILVVGINGAGKTTSIGKLAHRLQSEGYSLMLAAGDTFRAAAVEQLQTWGERNNVPVIAQHTGADSASVIFDALQSAQAKGVDVLIADTAGRLHTKSNLMDELKKIKRIMAKLDQAAPQEVLLILDAGTGQNALSQAKQFHEAVGLTGLALTKLDGTAKGGIIFALANQMQIPIRFIGVGEGIADLQDFDARNFVDALFEN